MKVSTMEAQAWICPKCHDDHAQDGPHTPKPEGIFMPASEDQSYIAQQYRILRACLTDANEQICGLIQENQRMRESIKEHLRVCPPAVLASLMKELK